MKAKSIAFASIGIVLFLIGLNLHLFQVLHNLHLFINLLIICCSDFLVLSLYTLILKTDQIIKYLSLILTISLFFIGYLYITKHLLTLFVTIPLGLLTLFELINHIINYPKIYQHLPFISYFKGSKHYIALKIMLYYLLRLITVYLKLLLVIAFFGMIKNNEITRNLNLSSLLALVIMIIGVVCYFLAFVRKTKEQDLLYPQGGLYKAARYPDILGKLLVYLGIYLFMLSLNPRLWVLFLSPLSYLLAHVFIVLPIKDKQLAKADNTYIDYQKKTNLLLIDNKLWHK